MPLNSIVSFCHLLLRNLYLETLVFGVFLLLSIMYYSSSNTLYVVGNCELDHFYNVFYQSVKFLHSVFIKVFALCAFLEDSAHAIIKFLYQ